MAFGQHFKKLTDVDEEVLDARQLATLRDVGINSVEEFMSAVESELDAVVALFDGDRSLVARLAVALGNLIDDDLSDVDVSDYGLGAIQPDRSSAGEYPRSIEVAPAGSRDRYVVTKHHEI